MSRTSQYMLRILKSTCCRCNLSFVSSSVYTADVTTEGIPGSDYDPEEFPHTLSLPFNPYRESRSHCFLIVFVWMTVWLCRYKCCTGRAEECKHSVVFCRWDQCCGVHGAECGREVGHSEHQRPSNWDSHWRKTTHHPGHLQAGPEVQGVLLQGWKHRQGNIMDLQDEKLLNRSQCSTAN